MLFDIHESNIPILTGAAELILRTFAFEQGQTDAIQAKRESWAFRQEPAPPSEEYGQLVELFPRTLAGVGKSSALKKASMGEEETDNYINEGILKFTDKEISEMPKSVKKFFRMQGKTVHYRERKDDGRYNKSYEVRYAKKPYNKPPISVSATSIEELKARFIEKLNNYVPQSEAALSVPTNFDLFATYWFDNFHKAKVTPETHKNNFNLYRRHIKEKLKGYKVKHITPIMLKELLSSLPGNGKTEDDVHSILNQIFDTAVTHGLISVNPLNMVVHLTHEKVSGVELTTDEELFLLQQSKGTPYEVIFALMLYAGLRPNEFKTARIDGEFIKAKNSKQKRGKIEYKRIPIISHLRALIGGKDVLEMRSVERTRYFFNRILPNHTLKDLRKTFSTKCINCKVDFFAKEKFLGHSIGKLEKPYTGNIDDYLLSESKKLDSWYTVYPKNTPIDEE